MQKIASKAKKKACIAGQITAICNTLHINGKLCTYNRYFIIYLYLGKSSFMIYNRDRSRRYASLLNLTSALNVNVAIGESHTDNSSFYLIKDHMNGLTSVDEIQKKKFKFSQSRTLGNAHLLIFVRLLIHLCHIFYRLAFFFNHKKYDPGRYVFEFSKRGKKNAYNRDKDLSAGEYSSLNKLKDFCDAKVKRGEKALVYYFHNKGACCVKDALNVSQEGTKCFLCLFL